MARKKPLQLEASAVEAGNIAKVVELVNRIRPLLHGHHPTVQSAVLADLLATWVAGHFADTRADTAAYREQLIAHHIDLMRDLIKPNEEQLREQLAENDHSQR
jgi:hypothetical protein